MARQRRSPRRWAAPTAFPVAAALLTTGCSNGRSGDAPGDGPTEFPLAHRAADDRVSPRETLAQAHVESHPDDSHSQDLRTRLQAGDAPDVVQTPVTDGPGQNTASGASVPSATALEIEEAAQRFPDRVAEPERARACAGTSGALGTGVRGLPTGRTTVQDVLRSMDAAWDE